MVKRIVIIGAVAGGASTAARARRLDENAEITVFEQGQDPSFANCGMPYFIGNEITDRSLLTLHTPATLKARLNIDVLVLHRVMKINPESKSVLVRNLSNNTEFEKEYDELVLALGAKPFSPPIPGIDRHGGFQLRSLQDMDDINSWIIEKSPKTAVVCGGGFIGVEMAEQLSRRGMKVSLVEAAPQLLGPLDPEQASRVANELTKNNVDVIIGAGVKEFRDGDCLASVVIAGDHSIAADLVILGFGVRPDTDLAKDAGVELNARGGIKSDCYMRTNVPNIWAVGDDVEIENPVDHSRYMVALAGPANREGRLCADNMINGPTRKYRGTMGSSILRCFSLTAACTGMNERALKAANIQYGVVHVHPNSHAGYYPGAHAIALKILFQIGGAEEGRLLGAQAVGEDGVDNRMNVLATALQAGMNVNDLAELELCYAPPFGSAKDPVNIAGMTAQNVLEDCMETIQWHEFDELAKDENNFILDVRSASEIANNGALHPRALNIPVNDVRSRLHEIPKDRQIIVSCASGQRSYYACRILMQNGYKCKNLDGAYITYSGSKIQLN